MFWLLLLEMSLLAGNMEVTAFWLANSHLHEIRFSELPPGNQTDLHFEMIAHKIA